MLKSLFLAALVASIFYIVSSTKTGCQSSATPSSTSSSSYSSSSSSASSSSSSSTYQSRNPPDSDDDDNCGTDDDDDDNKGKCKENETYVDCPDYSCDPQSCDQIGYPVACPDLAPNATCPGKPGCICKSGYVRNKKGVCIPTNQCPSCGGDPHATGGCSNYCGHQCSDYNKKPAACALFCIINGCACKTNYVYDSNIEKCVLPKDCTPVCESNEVYSNCTNGGCFGARKCSEKGIPVRCVKLDPKKCKKGCLCKDGYLRDDNGKCVKEDKCGGCSKPHEVYDPCPAKCPFRTCGIDDRVVRCAAPPEVGSPDCPPPTCRCEDGYFRSNNGDCVTWDECPKCGENEVYDGCANGGCYGARNCSEIGRPVICVDLIEGACKGACICKDKYLRNDNGDCIPESKCPKKPVCGENEVYSNCTNGGCYGARNCSEKGQPIRCVKLDPKNCKKGCLCADGYLRDDNGKCIPEDQCGGSKPVCGKNEVYSNCSNGGCFGARKCSEKGQPIRCVKLDPKNCKKGCLCADGYLRDDNGKCIPEDQCGGSTNCTKPHEVYKNCTWNCPPNTCESIGKSYSCPLQSDSNCKPACVCENGYYRNHIGECISEANCLKCTGPNEYYSCGGGCDNVCATLKKQNQTNCPIVNIKCNEMCYCYEGYARNASNICVPFDQCPESTRCTGEHEYYDDCPPSCSPETCDSIGKNITCLPSAAVCRPSCRCEKGYYRNSKNKCVLEKDCDTGTGCQSSTPKPGDDDDSCSNIDQIKQQFSKGLASFTAKFLKEVIASTDESVVTSPFSVDVPLSELVPYSSGDTRDQMTTAVGLQSKNDIKCFFKNLLSGIKTQKDVEINIAANNYVNENYPLSESFLEYTKEVFGASAQNVDCSKPDETASTINEWVEDNTNNRIQNLVSPDMITPDTRLVIVDAIYFKGNWLYQFNPNDTQKQTFYVTSDNTQEVDMMYQKHKFMYGESEKLNAKILELPYANQAFTCRFILPNEVDGLKDVVDAIQDDRVLSDAVNSMSNQTVKVWIPLMEISTSIDLGKILSQVGVTDLFDSSKCKLQGILKVDEPLYASAAIQKAYIKMDETGSEAAAANAVIISTTSAVLNPPPQPEFRADHPFMYCIYYNGDALFCGAYRKPN